MTTKSYKIDYVYRGEGPCGCSYTEYTPLYDYTGNFPLKSNNIKDIISKAMKKPKSHEFVITQSNPYKREFFYTSQNISQILRKMNDD